MVLVIIIVYKNVFHFLISCTLLFLDNLNCAAHAINEGLVINEDGTATMMFEGTGPDSTNPITNFFCTIQNLVESTVTMLVAAQPCKCC